ncbi:hypothetical protein V6N12_065319 [Hibiscus sabdariffa]|uniref:Gag/pol protein n=1 Tax=Hibiscus sabdariffa TaxID=183260 RepID=A0ABR2G9B3_9ROSI
MSEGSPVGAHVIKMMGYIQTLENLGFPLNDQLAIDVIMQSLSDSFNQFVLNFNMNEINKTLPQLLGMLRTAESNKKKNGSKSVLMIRVAKRKGKKVAKSKGIGKTKPKGKNALKPKGGISKERKCFHCDKPGHWKRNCPVYLEEVEKAKAVRVSTFGIYVIDVKLLTYRNQHGKSIKALRSDRGEEYLSQDFDELLKERGIVSQLTPPGTPQWNGVSNRRNRTLLDMVRLMMSHSDLSTSFWGHALETTAFTLNCVLSKSVQKTPHEMWTGKRPGMSFMKVWGCKAYVKHHMSTKLEPKSHKCAFVEYPKETKGYYFFNPKENKVFVTRMGVFLEKSFSRTMGMVEILNLKKFKNKRSRRERHEPERYGFLVTTHGDVILVDQDEPKTYQEAVSSPDSEK